MAKTLGPMAKLKRQGEGQANSMVMHGLAARANGIGQRWAVVVGSSVAGPRTDGGGRI